MNKLASFRRNGAAVLRIVAVCAIVALAPPGAYGAESATLDEKPLPEEIAPEIREVLSKRAFTISNDGGPLFDFWLREKIPLATEPAGGTALEHIPETVLIGAVQVHKNQRDFRDDPLPAGMYTMRFGRILEDGNHLGASPVPYFAVLMPADEDTELDPFDGNVRLMHRRATDVSPHGHPSNLNMREASHDAEEPELTEDFDDTRLMTLQWQGCVDSADAPVAISFSIVFEGHGEH